MPSGGQNKVDMIGKKFNRLTVVSDSGIRKWGHVHWNCICDCGKRTIVSGVLLRRENTKSCGCLKIDSARENGKKKVLDITGHRFDRLVAQYRIEDSGGKKVKWFCVCDCGNTTTAQTSNLRNGHSKSCGCLGKECVWNKLPDGESAKNVLFGSYKDRARKKKQGFTLTKEKFLSLVSDNCFYCGVDPLQKFNNPHFRGEFKYNGIDRVDSSKGYIEGNCITSCGQCNMAKRDYTFKEFIKWIERVHKHIEPFLVPDYHERVLNEKV